MKKFRIMLTVAVPAVVTKVAASGPGAIPKRIQAKATDLRKFVKHVHTLLDNMLLHGDALHNLEIDERGFTVAKKEGDRTAVGYSMDMSIVTSMSGGVLLDRLADAFTAYDIVQVRFEEIPE